LIERNKTKRNKRKIREESFKEIRIREEQEKNLRGVADALTGIA